MVFLWCFCKFYLDDENEGVNSKLPYERKEVNGEKSAGNPSNISFPSTVLDHEIEILLSEWNKNPDMLFSIHPVDGSLLVWHVDWLDEYQPGMFRQVQVIILRQDQMLDVFLLCL